MTKTKSKSAAVAEVVKPDAMAPRPSLVPAEVPADVLALFQAGDKVTVPEAADEIIFVPSYTVPPGRIVQGRYGGSRVEETADPETGEVGSYESFLFRDLNSSGQDVWLRGGWGFGQLIKLAKLGDGQLVTVERLAQDKPHPKDRRMRIAQFKLWKGE